MFEHEANSLGQSATPAHCAEMHGAGMRRGLHAQSSAATSVPRWVALLAATATATVMAGCAIGPNYHAPKLPAPLPAQFVEARGERYAAGTPLAAEVWKSFGDAELDALIARAQQENRGIAQARARSAIMSCGCLPARWACSCASTAASSGSSRAASAPVVTTMASGRPATQ